LLDAEAVFDLNGCKCLANSGFRKKALAQLEEIIRENREEFLEIWRLLNEEN
jgi:hypothetical protein